MALPMIIMTGTVVDEEPELRYTPSGAPVVRFRVACNRRVQDPTTKEWRDADVCFLSVEAWRHRAENIAETLRRGVTVTVTGDLRERSYDKDGEKRKVYEVINANVAVDLTHQVATVTKRSAAVAGQPTAAKAPAASTAPAAAPAATATTAAPSARPLVDPPF